MYGSDNPWLLGIPLRAEDDSFGEFADGEDEEEKDDEEDEEEDDEEEEDDPKGDDFE